jgi:hypothetical protein
MRRRTFIAASRGRRMRSTSPALQELDNAAAPAPCPAACLKYSTRCSYIGLGGLCLPCFFIPLCFLQPRIKFGLQKIDWRKC